MVDTPKLPQTNPNFSQQNAVDFFSFINDYYTNQSTQKRIETVGNKVDTVERKVNTSARDIEEIKKDVNLIKNSIDTPSSSLPPITGGSGRGSARSPATPPRPTGAGGGRGAAITAGIAAVAGAASAYFSGSSSSASTGTAATDNIDSNRASGSVDAPSTRAPVTSAPLAAPSAQTSSYPRGSGVLASVSINDSTPSSQISRPPLTNISSASGGQISFEDAIRKAAKETGVDAQALATIALAESRGQNVANESPEGKSTGASGFFQHIPSTWIEQLLLHGHEKGIIDPTTGEVFKPNSNRNTIRYMNSLTPEQRQQLLDLRNNNELSAYFGATLAKDNMKASGIDPKASDFVEKLFMSNFLGAAGARSTYNKSYPQNEMEKVIRANAAVFGIKATKNADGTISYDFNNSKIKSFEDIDPELFLEYTKGYVTRRIQEHGAKAAEIAAGMSAEEESVPQQPQARSRSPLLRVEDIFPEGMSLEDDVPGITPSVGLNVLGGDPMSERPGTRSRGSQPRTDPRFLEPDRSGGRSARAPSIQVSPEDRLGRVRPRIEPRLGPGTPAPSVNPPEPPSSRIPKITVDEVMRRDFPRSDSRSRPLSERGTPGRERPSPITRVFPAIQDIARTLGPGASALAPEAIGLVRSLLTYGIPIAVAIEIASRYKDKSPEKSAEELLRQLGVPIPTDMNLGTPGSTQFPGTPDEMEDTYRTLLDRVRGFNAPPESVIARVAISEAQRSAEERNERIVRAIETQSDVNQGMTVMQPIIMPQTVVERNTPAPAGQGSGVPPPSPIPSSVERYLRRIVG